MNGLENDLAGGFLAALSAPARAADIPAADDLYGWLIGSWEMDVLHYRVDMRSAPRRGEIHFGWVLEGRAVQDVWIMPPRGDSPSASDAMYGTTLRVWDPAARLWRVTYVNPRTGQHDELTGRRIGSDLVQIGRHADGTPIRWNFTDITRDSFRWNGVALEADGVTWRLEAEFHARRRGAASIPLAKLA
ncbi:hypothetical protein [Paraburkholderia susongensis]|uniref:THAP4-like heme-binding beta-barrel domain-containing protein n=1 Tax=Paraburkholderia susongensis TaxID=1515439 RepID=A0A1X7JIC9_9BURK|nr:hypothetical protein [Paraburkholderia susongensis]SMG27851.1 hypothetical protein SAMN06265784_102697 [Paraburkholderia susongensis]